MPPCCLRQQPGVWVSHDECGGGYRLCDLWYRQPGVWVSHDEWGFRIDASLRKYNAQVEERPITGCNRYPYPYPYLHPYPYGYPLPVPQTKQLHPPTRTYECTFGVWGGIGYAIDGTGPPVPMSAPLVYGGRYRLCDLWYRPTRTYECTFAQQTPERINGRNDVGCIRSKTR